VGAGKGNAPATVGDVDFTGLLSFPLTPFDAEDRVDLDVLRTHVDQQVAAGAAAVFVACGTGEFSALTPQEHRDVVATAVRTVAGRVPVFAGAGGGAGLAREFVAQAAACGADGVLLLPPYLVSSTAAGLVRHVAYAAAGASIPVIVYQRANAVFSRQAALDLLEIGSVAGLKDGIGDVDALLRTVTAIRSCGHPDAADFCFLNGMPTAELSALAYRAIGVTRYSSAVHCFAPDIAHAFHTALTSGDDDNVTALLRDFYLPFAELRDQVPGYAVALVKAGARLAGLPVGGVRPPLVDPTPAHVDRLAEVIDQARTSLPKPTHDTGSAR
jgi:5-dehydro-4-deoxyglucarate dehydratase